MFLTNTTSAWAHQQSKLTASKQATSKRASSAAAVIKHYHHQGETWKPKYQILKKFVGVK